MDLKLRQFYGDKTRWFIATVEDASPPYGLEGRVKIRVHGLHTENTAMIPQHDLPWAQCVTPTTEGGVSGIGRTARRLPGSMVFGFFMDGDLSQTPIILGSLPKKELPSQIQTEQILEDVGIDIKPESGWKKFANAFTPNLHIDDDNTGSINSNVRKTREKTSVRFFLNIGYSLNQAIGITATLSGIADMKTGSRWAKVQGAGYNTPRYRGYGIANWDEIRYSKVKQFSAQHKLFTTQLAFVAFDLRGQYGNVNVKLLQTNKLKGDGGSLDIFSRLYIGEKPTKKMKRKANKIQDEIG